MTILKMSLMRSKNKQGFHFLSWGENLFYYTIQKESVLHTLLKFDLYCRFLTL